MSVILKNPQSLRVWRSTAKGSVGFVPTMGALHQGHEELLRRARAENDKVVLSIFVNPTQFNNSQDLEKYPATWESDLAMAEKNGVDTIFFPQAQDMYPDGYRYKVTENQDSLLLDGAHRPGHFDGVLSVVMKLFNLVRPDKAYFGEKDFQQLSLVRGMVDSFFMDIEVVPVATVREVDGLAKSSRNLRLTPEQREMAPAIYIALTEFSTAQESSAFLTAQGFKVDYVTDVANRRFVAASLGDVRLIDNVEI